MTDPRQIAERALAAAQPRALYSALFNMANAYNQAAESAFASIASTGNADFAGPAIMCRSFAIELLLKFFIAAKHRGKKFKELEAAGISLKGHRYSSLFDRIEPSLQKTIAKAYSEQSGTAMNPASFRDLLVALGDEPFVTWRYMYESDGTSHMDTMLLAAVTQALGLAAQSLIQSLRAKAP